MLFFCTFEMHPNISTGTLTSEKRITQQVCRLCCMRILLMPSTVKGVCGSCCFCALLLVTKHYNIKLTIIRGKVVLVLCYV